MFAEVGIERLADVAVAACASMDHERRKIVTAILRDTLADGRVDSLRLGLAEPEKKGPKRQEIADDHRAGVVIVLGPDDTANLLALGGRFGNAAEVEPRLVLKQLLDLSHKWLEGNGVTFSQAMRAPETEQPVLEEAGYRKLATLDYMCLAVPAEQPVGSEQAQWDARGESTSDGSPNELNLVSYELKWASYEKFFSQSSSETSVFSQLVSHVDETYIDSLDCPAIAEFRDTESVLRGYQNSPSHRVEHWLIASVDVGGDEISEAIGCLLLTHHPAGGSLEVTYMGIVPRWRGCGLANQFLRRASEVARSLGVPHLTLAVDQANVPAIKLYASQGFEILMSESVWGRKIG